MLMLQQQPACAQRLTARGVECQSCKAAEAVRAHGNRCQQTAQVCSKHEAFFGSRADPHLKCGPAGKMPQLGVQLQDQRLECVVLAASKKGLARTSP